MTDTFPLTIREPGPLTIRKPGAMVVVDRRLEELLAINLLDDERPRLTTRHVPVRPRAARRRPDALVTAG